jgi:thioredoxin-dependent peroxiredoxin
MGLAVGDVAPEFVLMDAAGVPIALSSLRGMWVVLYFYPRDNTPGCTKEACAFRDLNAEFVAKNAVIYGVSLDNEKAHNKFITKHDLPFQLLIDADGAISTQYESYGLKKFMGKEYLGISRNTFLISPEGTIAKIYKKVKPEIHPASVLEDIP